MHNNETINTLCNLAQLDIDVVYTYETCLNHINDIEIYAKIKEFRNDHLEHIHDLTLLILNLGGIPPQNTKDLKGYVIEGLSSLRSITGTVGALHSMETNEIIANNTYKDILDNKDLSLEIKQLLEKNYRDENRHLIYIQDTLKKIKSNQ